MPIRKLTFHASLVGVMLTSSTLASANTALWKGSYAAEGTCFCAGSLGREIDSRITPTPIGGQSIAQVCERIGAGPKLQKVNGKFNFTVFPDAQCGHGPNIEASTDAACLGHMGVSGEDCSGKGPVWNLSDAYAENAPTIETEASSSDFQTAAVTGGSRYIMPPLSKSETSVASIVESREDATQLEHNEVADVEPAKPVNRKPRKVAKAVPETREQIQLRQRVHLMRARERAALREAELAASKPEQVEKPVVKPQQSADAVAENATTKIEATPEVTQLPAFKVPTAIVSNRTHDFDYVEGAPVNYDFGGAGVSVAASKSSYNRVQYLLDVAVADSYSEAAVGVGVFFKPLELDRLTFSLSAGVEHGQFNFKRDALKADLSDTGAFLKLSTRFVVTRAFELQAGVGYSSFFEGDAIGFGAAFYHLTPQLDLTAKAEVGDNDLLGFGFRFHY